MGKTGEVTIKEIYDILSESPVEYDTFIELGTYKGTSTLNMSKVFKKVHTIEIVPELREEAMKNCREVNNIEFHLGDTVKLLPSIIDDYKNKSCVYLVDSHQSGPETSNNGQWVPLLDELDIICKRVCAPQILIFDDVRLFGAHWDWANVSLQSITQKIKSYDLEIKSSMISNDRFIVYI